MILHRNVAQVEFGKCFLTQCALFYHPLKLVQLNAVERLEDLGMLADHSCGKAGDINFEVFGLKVTMKDHFFLFLIFSQEVLMNGGKHRVEFYRSQGERVQQQKLDDQSTI
jgi:hypothetical protein